MRTMNNSVAGKCWDWLISTEKIYSQTKQTAAILHQHQTPIQLTAILRSVGVCQYTTTTTTHIWNMITISDWVAQWWQKNKVGLKLQLRLAGSLLRPTGDFWLSSQENWVVRLLTNLMNVGLWHQHHKLIFTRVKPHCSIVLAQQQTYNIISCKDLIYRIISILTRSDFDDSKKDKKPKRKEGVKVRQLQWSSHTTHHPQRSVICNGGCSGNQSWFHLGTAQRSGTFQGGVHHRNIPPLSEGCLL